MAVSPTASGNAVPTGTRNRSVARRPGWRLVAAVVTCLALAALVVYLGLFASGVGSWPGLVLAAAPAVLLFDLGYRGSLIGWGDGYAWLTDAGIGVVYGPVVLALGWLSYRLLAIRRIRERDS
jgi:hypothetical protein